MAEQSEVPVAEVGVEATAREPAGGGATTHPAFARIAAGGARRPPVADLGNVGEISEVLLSLQRTAGNRAVTRVVSEARAAGRPVLARQNGHPPAPSGFQ